MVGEGEQRITAAIANPGLITLDLMYPTVFGDYERKAGASICQVAAVSFYTAHAEFQAVVCVSFIAVLQQSLLHETVNVTQDGSRISVLEWPAGKAKTRKDLADWIVHRDNPLTSRVIVNQIWANLFGSGLVRTPEAFGLQGEQPTDPDRFSVAVEEALLEAEPAEGHLAGVLDLQEELVVDLVL